MKAAADQIDLLKLVESYRLVIYTFHSGFDDLLWEHHKTDLEFLEAMQADLRAQQTDKPAS